MSNHIIGNWFVSVFQMAKMSTYELDEISNNTNYRFTTRRNAKLWSNYKRHIFNENSSISHS